MGRIRLPVSSILADSMRLSFYSLFLLWLFWGYTVTQAKSYPDERVSEDDLELVFMDETKESVFIPREKLRDMGVEDIEVYIPYIGQRLRCSVLPLANLYAHFGLTTDTAASAESYDGYYSIYPSDFTKKYAPYIVLSIEGNQPGDMKLEGAPDLGPYYITFAKDLRQGSPELFDPDNKRPYGVSKITLGSYEELLGFLYEDPFGVLTQSEAIGRDLYINNCMSCHAWKPEGPGGTFSNRTAPILSVHAKFNKEYFVKYIVDPTVFIPDVKMPKHPHYDAEKIQAIADFLAKVPL